MKKQKILIRPIVTEKFLKLQEEKKRQYAFEVAQDVNKIEIKNAVEKKFDVAVDQVRTLNSKGKTKQMNTRRGITKGKRPDVKKAIVTLREGDSIDFFGGS
jgi:large subunit ribosomal protein L23